MTLLKSIVAGLVLANVGYFLWAHGIAAPPEAVIATPSLTLASEAGGAAGSVARDAAPPAVAEPADSATIASGPPVTAAPAAAGAPTATPNRCVSVGPFREVSEAARVAGTLRSSGYDPRQRVADGEVWAGVWVYLPLPPAPAAAEQMLDKLKSAGIDDALEMPGPNDTSVISLGLFSEQKRAQARVAQAEALSLSPAIAERKRNGSVFWIDIDLRPAQPTFNPNELPGESSRIVRLEMKPCPDESQR